MRLAYVQLEPRLGDPDSNRRAMARLLPAAAGADLVVLPELASSGYHFADAAQARAASEPADGPTAAALARLCREHGFTVVCGLDERDGDRLYNSAIVVGPDGLLGVHRKLHLFARESLFFTPGDRGFPVFRIGEARVGVLICYDYSFPECWTVLFRAGVDVVAHPSNFVLRGRAQRVVPVMAMLHRFYVVTANRVGVERGVGGERDLVFTGESMIASPGGDLLACGAAEGEEVAQAEAKLSEARDKQLTPQNHLMLDRRPELYGPLVEPLAPLHQPDRGGKGGD